MFSQIFSNHLKVKFIIHIMEIIREHYKLLCANMCPGKNSIDIMEHLPTLYNYAKTCDSVFETGVRGCVSSWAFTLGLLDNTNGARKKLFMNDIDKCDVELLIFLCKKLNIDVNYEWTNNLLLDTKNETYDITFIDTWHVYGQLKRELAKFSKITNKYIIMHDTTVDGEYGETIRLGWNAQQQSVMSGFPVEEINNGLWPAIDEFLKTNPEWYLKERFTNNNGLTVLEKRENAAHPITFSFPEEKITDVTNIMQKKVKIMSSLIPGKMETYIYENETDYYNEYQQSLFATTQKKAGYDCLRHYEIIANGCIPFFEDIVHCSPNTLSLFPKQMIEEGNNLYRSILGSDPKSVFEISPQHMADYEVLLTQLTNYLKMHLTTTQVAKYVLKTAELDHASKVLFLSGDTSPDYLRCLTLHGFKQLMGAYCHDYPMVPHLYKDSSIDYKSLYGKGITYTNLLDRALHNDVFDTNLEMLIKTRYFDAIVYGSYHRGMPLIDLVTKYYNTHEIVLMCGEDLHKCNHAQMCKKGFCTFVREL